MAKVRISSSSEQTKMAQGQGSAWTHNTVCSEGHKEILICSGGCWAVESAAGLNQAGRKQRGLQENFEITKEIVTTQHITVQRAD